MGPVKIRRFRHADLEGYSALCNASEATNPDFRRLTAEDIRTRILESPEYDPEGHFVAVADGRIVGGGRGVSTPEIVKVKGPVAYLDLFVHPDYVGTDAERTLFARIADHLKERGVERILTRVDTRFTSKVGLLERLGFTMSEYENHGMERSAEGAEEPMPPKGYRFRTARIPEDLEATLRVFNEAFATRDRYVPMSMERWRRTRSFANPENHSGIFLIEKASDGAVVGIVLSDIDRAYNEEHGVRRGGSYALAVIPSERRKGIGTALLRKSIRWIGERGMDTAYLSVNVANPDALNVYRAAGYKTVQVYRGYERALPWPPPELLSEDAR